MLDVFLLFLCVYISVILYLQPPCHFLPVVYITLEVIEVHFVETLQMVHNWLLGASYFGPFHCLAPLLHAGMYLLFYRIPFKC